MQMLSKTVAKESDKLENKISGKNEIRWIILRWFIRILTINKLGFHQKKKNDWLFVKIRERASALI